MSKLNRSDQTLNRAYALSRQSKGLRVTSHIVSWAGIALLAVSLGSDVYAVSNMIEASRTPAVEQKLENSSEARIGIGTALISVLASIPFSYGSSALKKGASSKNQQARETFKSYVRGNPSAVTSKNLETKLLKLKDHYPVLGSYRIPAPNIKQR
ncbi:hypothetical protein SAMN05444392_11557 [Seinonella peptonophila]|uniref:Uncharacterized protein n=1 Tax=Seinonella peptonophila TaxID=112248 RepID=A0A1M5ARG9_9BACL|nr:hypothetical protein [Seinonella peptonophila]SHF32774.1 hypothetical protein SAMN05444392_11557 [Seinonella peptonophila]